MRDFVALGCVFMFAAGSASADPGKWKIERATTALTGTSEYTASLDSEAPLFNQIGQPEAARLVIHCQEKTIGVYFAWPQVVSHDTDSMFLHLPQTMAYMRVDDGKIKEVDLNISDSGTAAGKWMGADPINLAMSMAHSSKVVVRISGSSASAQDAVFDTTGIDDVIHEALTTCFPTPQGAPLPHPDLFQRPDDHAAATAHPGAVLGAAFADVPPLLANMIGRPGLKAVLIAAVTPNSVADHGGLLVGDVVTKFDEHPTPDTVDLQAAVHGTPLGKKVVATVVRGGKDLALTFQF